MVDDAAHYNESVSANLSFMAVFIHTGGTGHRRADMPVHTSALLVQRLKTGHTHVLFFRPTVARPCQTITVAVLGDLDSDVVPALFALGGNLDAVIAVAADTPAGRAGVRGADCTCADLSARPPPQSRRCPCSASSCRLEEWS